MISSPASAPSVPLSPRPVSPPIGPSITRTPAEAFAPPRASAAGEEASSSAAAPSPASGRRCSSSSAATHEESERGMTVTARGRSGGGGGGAGMEKCDAPGFGFLGLDQMRVLLPEKLSASRTLRTHLFTNYRMRKVLDSSRWLIPLWVAVWVVIASLIYLWISYQAFDKRRESLAIMCDDRARMLQDQLNVSMNHLQALAILVSTFHHSKTPSAIDQVRGLLLAGRRRRRAGLDCCRFMALCCVAVVLLLLLRMEEDR